MKWFKFALLAVVLSLMTTNNITAGQRHNGNGLNYASAVFIGTSITLGIRVGVTATQTIPYLVGNNLGDVPSYNRGVGGNTSTQILARFDTDALTSNPAMISIEAGTNEPGAGISVGTFTTNIETMIQRAYRSQARVTLFVSPYTCDGGGPGLGLDGQIEPYRVAMRTLAVTYATDLFDTYADFIALPGATQTAYFNPGDCEHFSPAGLAWNASLVGSGTYVNSFKARQQN